MKITVIGSHLCPDTLYALNHIELQLKSLKKILIV